MTWTDSNSAERRQRHRLTEIANSLFFHHIHRRTPCHAQFSLYTKITRSKYDAFRTEVSKGSHQWRKIPVGPFRSNNRRTPSPKGRQEPLENPVLPNEPNGEPLSALNSIHAVPEFSTGPKEATLQTAPADPAASGRSRLVECLSLLQVCKMLVWVRDGKNAFARRVRLLLGLNAGSPIRFSARV